MELNSLLDLTDLLLSRFSLYRQVRELHVQAARELEVDGECYQQIDHLLNQLQQLLVGISIMQVAFLFGPQTSPLKIGLIIYTFWLLSADMNGLSDKSPAELRSTLLL